MTRKNSLGETLRNVPWRLLRRAYATVRRGYFSYPKPDRDGLLVDAGIDELRRTLGRRNFHPNWEFSYDKGAELNLARPRYEAQPAHDQLVWWQTHVRAWRRDAGGVELHTHFEPAPTEHPKAHLGERGLDVDRATVEVTTALDDAGIHYQRPGDTTTD